MTVVWRDGLWEVTRVRVRRSEGWNPHDGVGAPVTDTRAALPAPIISLSLPLSFPSAHRKLSEHIARWHPAMG